MLIIQCNNVKHATNMTPKKAGINPKSKSLLSFDNQFHPPLLCRATLLNLKRDGKILNIPLYALNNFRQLIGDGIKKIPALSERR